MMLLYRPDHYCPPQYFADWINLLDRLFPAMQFVVVVPASLKNLLPETVICRLMGVLGDEDHSDI